MKILFCSQAAHTGGGVEAWMEWLSSALAERGWQVSTALAKGRFHDPDRYCARHRVLAPCIVDGTSGFREDRVLALTEAFRRYQPDVIVPVNLSDAIWAAARWKLSGADARLALCIHGQGDDRIEQVRAAAAFVDVASSVSRRVADRIAHAVDEQLPVFHIPTGVPSPLRVFAPRDRLRRLALIGRLDVDKRVRDAVPLGRLLRGSGIVLDIIGVGPDEHYLREELREETASGTVVFRGAMSRHDLYRTVYGEIDAIVIFSPAEGGPIVAWEAMAHGVVPVTSDYAGRSEEDVIRHGETGLVFPIGDVAAAAAAIRSVTAAGTLAGLSERAQAGLPAIYLEAAAADRWDSVLREVAERPARVGTSTAIPRLTSPGTLARLGFDLRGTSFLRRLTRRQYRHTDPGSEWPH